MPLGVYFIQSVYCRELLTLNLFKIFLIYLPLSLYPGQNTGTSDPCTDKKTGAWDPQGGGGWDHPTRLSHWQSWLCPPGHHGEDLKDGAGHQQAPHAERCPGGVCPPQGMSEHPQDDVHPEDY